MLMARTRPMTPTAMLSALRTVDGDGSGLDADLLDGREPGVADGLATLDSGGKVPLSQLPDTVIGAVDYQGSWNASTNSPDLGSLSPSKGDYYVVSVAGATSLGGINDWAAGDWAIYNGTAWEKVDNTDAVISVAGRSGAVVIVAGDIASGTFPVARGGTGLSTIASGAMLYASALDTVSTLAIGTAGQVMTSSGAAPQWSSSIDVTGTVRAKGAGAAGVQLDPNAATGNYTLSLSPATLTANRRWTFGDADSTAAAIDVAQTWSAAQTFDDDKLTIRGGAQGATTPKKLVFQVDTQAIGSTLTIDVGAQTTDRTITVPVLTGNRTLAITGQDNAFTVAQTIAPAASVDKTLSVGVATAYSLNSLKTASVFYADNSNWGFPCIFVADSIGRGAMWVQQGYSMATNTGNAAYLSLTSSTVTDLYLYKNGTSATVDTFNIQANKLALPVNSGSCGLSVANSTDATALGTGAVILSAGGMSVNSQLRVGGNVTIGAGSALINLVLNGAAATSRDIRFQTNGSLRWFFGADNTAESGSDAGSNFFLTARTDTGSNIDSPITISRISGGTLTLGGSGRPISVTGTVTLTDAKNIAVGSTTGTQIATANTQKLGFWGATPIAQKTGYGTPTGGSLVSSYPGATATLAQTSGTLAQLLLDLKAAGVIGA